MREVVRWPGYVHGLAGGAVGVCAVLCIAAWRSSAPWTAAVLPGVIALVVGLVWWKLRVLVVEAGPEGLAFGFGRPRRRVPRERIEEARVEGYSFARYLGWGYRIGWKPRERAYAVMGYRRGLRVLFADERGRPSSVFLSSGDPEALVSRLMGKET